MRACQLKSVFVMFVLGAALVETAVGQEPARGPGRQGGSNDEALQIVAYDVGDLIMDIKDYPYPGSDFGISPNPAYGGGGGGGMGGGMGGGGMGGGGGGMFQIQAEGRPSATAAKTSVSDLIEVLINVVAADTWAENGGGEAEVRSFGNSLVISQTHAVHQQIENLLEQLRAGSGERKSVFVDARWLLLTSDDLDQLIINQSEYSAVSREALAEFTRRPTTIRARTSCFSGQLVYVVSGTKRNIVSGYIPVVGSSDGGEGAAQLASTQGESLFRLVAENAVSRERNVGYQPIVEKPNVGAVLEIRPTLVQGSNSAIVDLKATVTGSAESASGEQAAVPMAAPAVDRVAIQSQELATTLRVPLGEPVLVGGMTIAPAEVSEEGESPQLYLVLEVQ